MFVKATVLAKQELTMGGELYATQKKEKSGSTN